MNPKKIREMLEKRMKKELKKYKNQIDGKVESNRRSIEDLENRVEKVEEEIDKHFSGGED